MRFFISGGLLVTLAFPVISLSFTSESLEATFDDIQVPKNAFEMQEVQQYAALQWDGFSVDSPRQAMENEFRGVEVKSEPNYAGGRVDAFGGLPTISTKYPSSRVAFFDLEKFWWGCSTKDENTGKPGPGWCTLEVYGYSHGAKDPTAKATSFFFPNKDAKSMQMVEASMPASFKALSLVTFSVLATNPTLFVDNVRYTVYNVTGFGRGLGEVIHTQESLSRPQGGDAGIPEIPLGAQPVFM